MQFTIMGLESFHKLPPSPTSMVEIRNDKLESAQICLRITQSQYKQVSKCSTTSEIWNELLRVYEQTAEAKASSLFVQFIHLQKKNSETMKVYQDKVTGLYHDLKVFDIDIGQIGLCAKALDGLSENYQQIKRPQEHQQGCPCHDKPTCYWPRNATRDWIQVNLQSRMN